jgi:endoglucanase
MWTQIAERYKEYSDYLIFESANEELGNRLNDTDIAEDSGTLSEDECYAKLLEINQAFVDTVRSTGGNNAQRFLLIAGYNTDITYTVDDRYEMPTDTATSKLLLSVHYYDPSGYCINESLASWGTKDDYDDMNESLAKLTKFTDEGYGVIIGEYGVLPKSEGGLKDNTYEYTENILNNCDLYGFVPVLWDTNGLYDKEFLSIISSKVSELFKDRSYDSQKDMTQEEVAAAAQASMDEAYENAGESFQLDDNVAMAWIMYTSLDWSIQYSVGDVYDPTTCTAGIVANDVEITGEGTYTVSLDFTGTAGGYADSTQFSALAIANGETLFPDYVIDVKEIKINGETYTPVAEGYTTTDDLKCTRVNLYNEWVTSIPDGIRTVDGSTDGVSPSILDNTALGQVQTIEVTFDYIAP